MVEALLALGGNVGDVRATLDRAIAQLCDGADVRLVARSSDYRTPPWGVKEQPPFVNLCIAIATTLSPRALLARAQEPEVKARLIENTQAAVERGAFGSPTFFVGKEMFFGKEQLREVEELVSGK